MNNNNRYYGRSVRGVCRILSFFMTKEKLLYDLFKAYNQAKRHKSKKVYVKEFSKNLYENLAELANDLYYRKYKAEPSTCFIITDPKKREVFAASFRDRIVHHLYYNYTHEMFEKGFIYDSYSCIPKRGTHFGIERLKHHILSESLNYSRPCYVLKLDIRGYFMHINRNTLRDLTVKIIEAKYKDQDTKDLVLYLTSEIILLNPIKNCIVIGSEKEWVGLPHNKSLKYSPEGCGLPIGNLTSQVFSNVYLDRLDKYCKLILKCRHYGRYVDDAYIVSHDKEFLKNVIPKIKDYMYKELGLELHLGKTQINNASKGVEFLGAYIKPYRTYMSNQCLRRMRRKINEHKADNKENKISSMISRCGMLSHYSSHNIKLGLLLENNIS